VRLVPDRGDDVARHLTPGPTDELLKVLLRPQRT